MAPLRRIDFPRICVNRRYAARYGHNLSFELPELPFDGIRKIREGVGYQTDMLALSVGKPVAVALLPSVENSLYCPRDDVLIAAGEIAGRGIKMHRLLGLGVVQVRERFCVSRQERRPTLAFFVDGISHKYGHTDYTTAVELANLPRGNVKDQHPVQFLFLRVVRRHARGALESVVLAGVQLCEHKIGTRDRAVRRSLRGILLLGRFDILLLRDLVVFFGIFERVGQRIDIGGGEFEGLVQALKECFGRAALFLRGGLFDLGLSGNARRLFHSAEELEIEIQPPFPVEPLHGVGIVDREDPQLRMRFAVYLLLCVQLCLCHLFFRGEPFEEISFQRHCLSPEFICDAPLRRLLPDLVTDRPRAAVLPGDHHK